MSEATSDSEPRQLAAEARNRVRFEEEALELADQVYRVARRLVSSREEAEDLVQETYARAFRSWQSYTPGTNMRAWLLRILTNLNIDRGRKQQRTPDAQPLEEGDYFLYNRMEQTSGTPAEERIDQKLSQDDDRHGAIRRSARLPRRDRARRHRRLQLRGRGADPRYPDRNRHVALASWKTYPQARAGRTSGSVNGRRYCERCEEVMQPFLDRQLTAEEQGTAEAHLSECAYCNERYTFENELRVLVKKACNEEMSPELKAKLASLKETRGLSLSGRSSG